MISAWRHRRMRHAVEAYLDGELRPQANDEVARHLAICWDCNTLAETLRLIKQSLRQRRDRTAVLLSERRLRRFAEDLAADPTSRPRPPRHRGRPALPTKGKD